MGTDPLAVRAVSVVTEGNAAQALAIRVYYVNPNANVCHAENLMPVER